MHELGKIESFYSEIGKIKGINSVSKIGHYLLEGDGLEKLINSQKLAANDSLKYSYMDKKKNNNNINNLECYYVSKDIFKLCNLTLSKGEKPTTDNLKEDYNILIIIQLVIINDNKFKYGVMLANGASIKDLFKIIICENVVKMILELALTWLTVILIINYYYNYSAVLRILILNVFYVMVIWKIIVLDLIICLTAMFISVIYLRKKNSYELLGGR